MWAGQNKHTQDGAGCCLNGLELLYFYEFACVIQRLLAPKINEVHLMRYICVFAGDFNERGGREKKETKLQRPNSGGSRNEPVVSQASRLLSFFCFLNLTCMGNAFSIDAGQIEKKERLACETNEPVHAGSALLPVINIIMSSGDFKFCLCSASMHCIKWYIVLPAG